MIGVAHLELKKDEQTVMGLNETIEDKSGITYLELRLLGHGIVAQIDGLGLGLGCVPTP